MSRFRNLGDLFEEEPAQYGLRGDTYLWRELRAHFSEVSIPETVSDLEQQLEQAFLLLTGQPMSGTDSFRVERLAHGGMSSGQISRAFWRMRALPLLKERWLQANPSASRKKSVEEDQFSRKVVVSIATSGLSPVEGARVIEISALELLGRKLTGRSMHTYLNPKTGIDLGATAIHGITAELLEAQDAPEFASIGNAFISFVLGAELIAHNAPFHAEFLSSELLSIGANPLEELCPRVVDTLQWAKTLRPGKKNDLALLCKDLKIEKPKEKFDTVLDAHMTALVYLKLNQWKPVSSGK